ncbi:uncharacterized protein AMSG_05391 [Thecamonas trahens ATCC 50062]|uniref:B box-type domain-containing protein n=1 Tax=Thecamonas trahens ATCC 50062 TaxID=461836 RepID=A0A0L0DBA0_THETB|nr:hypothetical protein AMSG_05391 [Thecamonas trahens ATCC 50062]KNC49391.1 hypothetical protein AMSG_05391 [Thecamonas trahens ATCC 50062]|eukprot:XP_013757816.1 hypothetical protein AMSG_05391 [Thecamonas trahens ATCC 50062]
MGDTVEHDGLRPVCESCEAAAACVVCGSCGGALCLACDSALHPPSSRLMTAHVRTAIPGLKPGGGSSVAAAMAAVMGVAAGAATGDGSGPCPAHPHLDGTYYCMSCPSQTAVCSECVVHGVHAAHAVALVADAAAAIRPQIDASAASIRLALGGGQSLVDGLRARATDHASAFEQAEAELAAGFDRLRAAVDKAQAAALNRLAGARAEHLASLEVLAEEVAGKMEDLRELDAEIAAASEAPGPHRVLALYGSDVAGRAEDLKAYLCELAEDAGDACHGGSTAALNATLDDMSVDVSSVEAFITALGTDGTSSGRTMAASGLGTSPRRRGRRLSVTSSPPPRPQEPRASPLATVRARRAVALGSPPREAHELSPAAAPVLSPALARADANTQRFRRLLDGYESQHRGRMRERRAARRAAAMHAAHSPNKLLFKG